jgi:hypothetical protein
LGLGFGVFRADESGDLHKHVVPGKNQNQNQNQIRSNLKNEIIQRKIELNHKELVAQKPTEPKGYPSREVKGYRYREVKGYRYREVIHQGNSIGKRPSLWLVRIRKELVAKRELVARYNH